MNTTTLPWGRYFSSSPAAPRESQPAPGGPSLEPAASPPSPPRKGVSWGVVFVLVAVLGFGIWSQRDGRLSPDPAASAAAIPTARAEVGTFRRSLRASGTIAAKNFAAIRAPRMRSGRDGRPKLTLTRLADAGTTVAAGTVVAHFENRWLEDRLDDMRSTLVQSKSAVEKRRAEIMIAQETEAQGLRVAKADFDKAELDVRTSEVRSQIEAEKFALAVEETSALLAQLEQETKWQSDVHKADIRSLELLVEKDQLHVMRHERDLERLMMKTPVRGLIVLESMYRGGGQVQQVQAGDQVNPGTFFMRVVDLSKMVVAGALNQVDSQKVRLGQKAEIRLDAYPDLILPGRVTSIGAMAGSAGGGFRWRATRDNYVKLVNIEVSIDAEDPRVIPDLSASVDILLEEQENTLLIPNAAIQTKGDKSFVYVRDGERFAEREVEIGLRNQVQAVIVTGLAEGDEVALREIPSA